VASISTYRVQWNALCILDGDLDMIQSRILTFAERYFFMLFGVEWTNLWEFML
jgi:hypothetical protein